MSKNYILPKLYKDILNNLIPKFGSYDCLNKLILSNELHSNELDISLSGGLSSLCIFFAELNSIYPNKNYDKIAHNYLSMIIKYIEKNINNINISLWGGLCGIALATACMSNNFSRYQNLLKKINDLIISTIKEKLKLIEALPLSKEEYYDVMYGLSGVASYHMLFLNSTNMVDNLKLIIKYFISLCKDTIINNKKFPGLTLDMSKSSFIQNKQKKYYINLGLSHGIPGILLILVKSYKIGINLDGQLEAIKYLKNIIINYCYNKNKRIYWPTVVTFCLDSNNSESRYYTRDAWCYGTPGVAYVLLKTSEVLEDSSLKSLATNAMLDSLKYKEFCISPTFCHGYAGLLYLAYKFSKLTKIEQFKIYQQELERKILSFYNSQNIFAFKDIDIVNGKSEHKDNIGLLSGTIGIILSLLAVHGCKQTSWDTAFLLDDY